MMEGRCEEDEIELCLELSVGGSYGKRRRRSTTAAMNDSNGEAALRFLVGRSNVVDLNEPWGPRYVKIEQRDAPLVAPNGFDHTLNATISSRESESSTRKSGIKSDPDQSASPPSLKRIVKKPPKAPNKKWGSNIFSTETHIPCVSATGNGPNGKTVKGFLCKYTRNEVSIMCECHGCSFSPAEFVQHAGGVNVSNPLRHITVVHPTP